MWDWLKKFFLNYLWLGFICLLLAILLDLEFPNYIRGKYTSISIALLENIGIAIIIASIFTYASGTSQFMEKIRNLLKDIIVKRDFLSNIDPKAKKDALKALIQPSSTELNKYPNIGNYYGYFIDKTLEIQKRCVRSNYSINAHAYFCQEHNLVAVAQVFTYRLYPSADGFGKITIGADNDISFCNKLVISGPSGNPKEFTPNELKLLPHVEGGETTYRAVLEIDDFARGKNHIDVEIHLTEFGQDHWKMIQFRALQPTDGFHYQLRCSDNIQVKEYAIFVVGAKYRIAVDEQKKSLFFSCNQWVNEGTGVSFVVSVPVIDQLVCEHDLQEGKIENSESPDEGDSKEE